MLAWAHANSREGTHARLSEFYGKSREDVTEWIEKVRRVIIANNWKDNWVHIIVAVYLKGAVTDYYEKIRDNVVRLKIKDLIIKHIIQ